jgi:hypothetical protein
MSIFYSVFNQALLEALRCKPLVELFSFSYFEQTRKEILTAGRKGKPG